MVPLLPGRRVRGFGRRPSTRIYNLHKLQGMVYLAVAQGTPPRAEFSYPTVFP